MTKPIFLVLVRQTGRQVGRKAHELWAGCSYLDERRTFLWTAQSRKFSHKLQEDLVTTKDFYHK